jgi:hypothetical protein
VFSWLSAYLALAWGDGAGLSLSDGAELGPGFFLER